MEERENHNRNLLSVDEIMDMFQVTRVTVLKWIREGQLKAVRIGQKYMITEKFLTEFIESNVVNNAPRK